MARRSLSFKLIFGGIIVVLIPLAIVGFIGVYNTSTTLEEIGKNRAEIVAGNLAQMVDNILSEETKIVAVMSTAPVVVGLCGEAAQSGKASDATVAKTNAWLGDLAKKIGKYYEAIIVTDTKGQVIADSVQGKSSSINVGDRSYFKAAQDGKSFISRPLTSKLSGTPVVAISSPVTDASGKFQGIVAVVMATEAFSKQVVSTRIGKSGYPFIVDASGVVVAHPNPKHILKTNLAQVAGMQEFMKVMLQGQSGVSDYTFEGIHKVAGFAPIAITKWSVGFTQDSDEFMGAAYQIRDLTILVAVIALVLTIIGVFFFSRTISRPITHAVLRLNEGSDHVATASSEVAQAGQSLAEGTSEQAASIEETSASLEELTSMTKQNTDNASQADSLMTQVSTMAASASEAMSEMRQSMDEISTSGQEISKIIKSIDEIAFQTNLLALNAAVEAARAGEAGAGFAVVADEVRNLAMRAAEAAKNTANLIEDTIDKIDHGNQLVGRVDESFTEVTTNAGKVAELVSEIAAASNEQSQGITQINTAVGEMEKVTQTTAASAEESAASAEELSAQAEEIRNIAGQLMSVVGGKMAEGHQGGISRPQAKPKRGLKKIAALPRPGGKDKAMSPRQKEIKSEDIIPLDDDDFADF